MDVNVLTESERAYLAGLIDGEGTITLTRKHKNENRQLAVTIANTERQLLDYTLKIVGAGKITRKRTQKNAHTPSYTYAIYNRQALAVVRQIRPYLRSYKARRADLILKYYIALTPRNGKYSDELLRQRKQFESDVLQLKANR